jgi:hypothetical protein
MSEIIAIKHSEPKQLRRVAMQPCNKKILTLAVTAAVSLSASVEAKVEPLVVNFTTVPNITLIEKTAMDFGIGMSLANNVACTMDVTDEGTALTFPGDIIMKTATGNGAGADAGNLGGPGCLASVGSTGTIGLYEISGIAGGTVKVTVNNITTGTSFNYVATGCVANYNDGGDGDSCEAIIPGSPVDAVIASSGDTVGNAGGAGIPAPGKTLIALGGVITTARTHVASEDMSESFTIDVTY